eukprot:CAMPEP_0174852038 /NCGR_PEP_ID=MMETSP1114-20130205/25111_1 /TAXON_ID=312471 /ORGANISM="Neobodo designis, Strain CCAP 1951/1" /LENGTH=55 /DNA_ID=CAMNT_0016086613 /DNA_START=74 /DNA_END=238 /DNA_ORIENTATION=+
MSRHTRRVWNQCGRGKLFKHGETRVTQFLSAVKMGHHEEGDVRWRTTRNSDVGGT